MIRESTASRCSLRPLPSGTSEALVSEKGCDKQANTSIPKRPASLSLSFSLLSPILPEHLPSLSKQHSLLSCTSQLSIRCDGLVERMAVVTKGQS